MNRAWDFVETPFGRGIAVVEDGSLVGFRFAGSRGIADRRDPAALKPFRSRVARYFAGKKGALGRVRLPGTTPFARRVYGVVASIPYGRVLTYGEVARAAGRPGAARAVGQLMARNPVPLALPCHRVVASGGGLGGFTGGLSRKRFLLALEGHPDGRPRA